MSKLLYEKILNHDKKIQYKLMNSGIIRKFDNQFKTLDLYHVNSNYIVSVYVDGGEIVVFWKHQDILVQLNNTYKNSHRKQLEKAIDLMLSCLRKENKIKPTKCVSVDPWDNDKGYDLTGV